MPRPTDVTILIPLYNEEQCVVANSSLLLRYLADRNLNGEIILGSNGSTDATPEMAGQLQREHPDTVRFFHLERRGAVGEVFKRAVAMASAPILISMDMDLSVDLEFIPRALSLLSHNAVVVGSKQSGSQLRSLWRLAGSSAFIFCAQTLLKLPYDDYSLSAKAYKLESIRPWVHCLSHDTNYVLDVIYLCHNARLPMAVLPVACEDWRKSRFRLMREAAVRFSYLFSLWGKSILNGKNGCGEIR